MGAHALELLVFPYEGGDRVDDTVARGCFVLRLEFQARGHVHTAAHDHGTVGRQTERTHGIGQGVGFTHIEHTVAVLVDKDERAGDVTVQTRVGDGQGQFLGSQRGDVARHVDHRGLEQVGQRAAPGADIAGRDGDRPGAAVDRAGVGLERCTRSGLVEQFQCERLSKFGIGRAGQYQALLGLIGAEHTIARWASHGQGRGCLVQGELESHHLRGIASRIGLLHLKRVQAVVVERDAGARWHVGPGAAAVARVLPSGTRLQVVEQHRTVVGDRVRAAVAGVAGQGQLRDCDAGVEREGPARFAAQVATGVGLANRHGFEAIARHRETITGTGGPSARAHLVLPSGTGLGLDSDLAVRGGDVGGVVLNTGVPDAVLQVQARGLGVHRQGEGRAGAGVACDVLALDHNTKAALPEGACDLVAQQIERPSGATQGGSELVDGAALGEDELDQGHAGLGAARQANTLFGFEQVDGVVDGHRAGQRGGAERHGVVCKNKRGRSGRHVARWVCGLGNE